MYNLWLGISFAIPFTNNNINTMLKSILASIALLASVAFAQMPSATVKLADGSTTNASEKINDGKPYIVSFWASWCKPCILELNTIAENYEDWQEETGVKIYAVSIDDARNLARAKTISSRQGWEYDMLFDDNQDLKRAMNVNNPPATFLFNGKGEIVYKHVGYAPGDEEELYEHLLELVEEDK